MSPPTAATDPWLGRLVGGRWKIVSLLDDSGGMASVYLADDTRLERQAVVKVPKATHLNAEFAERFAREAKWHARVENLHVVHILDRGEEAGTPFLVLQYLPGGNLKAWCERNPSMLADPRLHHEAWLLPIAQALDAVAAQGIVHRDVKPTNILFDAAGRGYLSDFGIVKAGHDATMTGTGMFIGTLQFMSPEQCQSEAKVTLDGRSDQYGLAVTAYQVLTGWKYPIPDTTVAQIVTAKLGFTPLTRPVEHDPRIPEAVNEAVMRALATDRDARFASSVEFAKTLLEGFGGRDANPSTDRHLSVAIPEPGTKRAPHLMERPSSSAGDTAPYRAGLATATGDVTARPGRVGSLPPTTAWKSVQRLGAAAIGMALLAGGYFFLGGGEGRRRGDGGAATGAIDVTAPRTTAVNSPRPAPPVGPAPALATQAVVEPAPVPLAVARDFDVAENSLSMKLVRIPAGEFHMGSNVGDADESPTHLVRITKAFLIGQTEVTQGQWQRVMETTPWKGKDNVKEGEDVAATYVSWDDAVNFCARLTALERSSGRLGDTERYRLPTEAEWEYACRAGTKTRFSFGDDETQLGEYAWWGGLFGNGNAKSDRYAHAVGLKKPNPWHLHDVHGNVWEWCNDWKGVYPSAVATDPTGATDGSSRVIRGGGWDNSPVYCRCANRSDDPPTHRYDRIGFRVVRELE